MKPQLKRSISLVLRAGDILQTALLKIVGRTPSPTCVVLYYHSVPSRHRELFARQMDLLLELAQPLPTDPPTTLDPGRRYAVVTFDDGFFTVLENAAPELERRRIPFAVFVPSGLLGRSPAWLRHAPDIVRQDRVMTADELRVLARDPRVAIGSHTVGHAHLTEIGPDRAAVELGQSKADLEAVLQQPVTQFSYPFGARTPSLDRQARALGYRRLFSTSPALAFRSPDEFLTGRVSVDPDISLLEFRLKVLGAYRWLAARNRRTTDDRGWKTQDNQQK